VQHSLSQRGSGSPDLDWSATLVPSIHYGGSHSGDSDDPTSPSYALGKRRHGGAITRKRIDRSSIVQLIQGAIEHRPSCRHVAVLSM